MDSNGKSNGKGRGSFLLEMMKQRAQMERSRGPSHSIGTPSVSSAEQTTGSSEGHCLSQSSSSGGRGRAQLASLIKSMSESESSSSSGVGHGRGSLLGLAKKLG